MKAKDQQDDFNMKLL
jgi:hypothetical protein